MIFVIEVNLPFFSANKVLLEMNYFNLWVIDEDVKLVL